MEQNSYDDGITPCPSNLDSPELQDSTQWTPYDNSRGGATVFHCSQTGYLENIEPTGYEKGRFRHFF